MNINLDGLKTEIEEYLEQAGMGVFYGYSRALESIAAVYWDCEQHPSYQDFVQAAKTAGAKLLVFHQREFDSEQLDEALEQLQACDLHREERRDLEQRLNRLRVYNAKVCVIELSFDHQGRVFIFDLRTEWYQSLSDILDEIQLLTGDDDDDDDPMGSYFSKN